MIELVSNCKHESNIAVYLETGSDGRNRILKVAISPTGVLCLERELAGYAWYAVRRGEKCLAELRRRYRDGIVLAIDYVYGACGVYKAFLVKNRSRLFQGVDHYIQLWPHEDNVPLHGDYSLNNMIFNGDGVHLVDWEHFNPTGSPWGFDVLFMLMVNLCGSQRGNFAPSEDDVQVVSECLDRLEKARRLPSNYSEKPLGATKAFVEENSQMWGRYPAKIPFLNIGEQEVLSFDRSVAAMRMRIPIKSVTNVNNVQSNRICEEYRND